MFAVHVVQKVGQTMRNPVSKETRPFLVICCCTKEFLLADRASVVSGILAVSLAKDALYGTASYMILIEVSSTRSMTYWLPFA